MLYCGKGLLKYFSCKNYVTIRAMSKKDKVKEKIIGLRFWLGIAVATLLAIAGWAISNFEKINTWLFFLSFVAVIFLCVISILITRRIDKHINKLEKMK